MESKFSKYRYYNGTRWIGGTAAYNHFFKENGGIDNVLNNIVSEAVQYAMQSFMASLSISKK